MNLGAVVNADMTTVRAWLVTAVQWWVGQLRELLPERLRLGPAVPGRFVVYDSESGLNPVRKNQPDTRPLRSRARIVLAIPEHLGLIRTLPVPRIGMSDIRRMVNLELERLTPLPIEDTVVAVSSRFALEGSDAAAVRVAIVPKAIAVKALDTAAEAGLVPTAVVMSPAAGRELLDFSPGLRALGLLPARRSPAAIWWGVVGFALVLNLIVLVVRDQQSVSRLAAMVEAQQPAVSTARRLAARSRAFEANADSLAERRQSHEALATLAAVSAALPEGAWVQRYIWDGSTLRLTGYVRGAVDLPAALRRDPRVVSVRSTRPDVIAETPGGKPYDLTLTLRAAGR